MESQLVEYFTPEDAEIVLEALSKTSKDYIHIIYNNIEIPTISIEELDLEALAGELHGISDPIGQLKDWLYDRMKELASWFADTVKGTLEWLWDNYIAPAFNDIANVLRSIWDFLQEIPGATENLIKWLEDQITNVWEWIEENIISPLSEALESITNFINDLITTLSDFISVTLPEYISKIPETIEKTIEETWNWIQDKIISPLLDSLRNMQKILSDAFNNISEYVTSIIDNIKQVLDKIGEQVLTFIENNIITPLSQGFETLINMIREGTNTITKFFTETMPEKINDLLRGLESFGKSVVELIQNNIIAPVTNLFDAMIDRIKEGLEWVYKAFSEQLPSAISTVLDNIKRAGEEIWSMIETNIITPLAKSVATLIDTIRGGLNYIYDFFTKQLPSIIEKSLESIKLNLEKVGEWIEKAIIDKLKGFMEYMSSMIDTITNNISEFLTKILPKWITNIGEQLSELPEKVWEKLTVAGKTIWEYITDLGKQIQEGFAKVSVSLEQTSKYLYLVGQYLTGFINSIETLPEKLKGVFGDLFERIVNALQGIGDFFSKIEENITNMFTDLWERYKWIGSKIWEGLQWLVGNIWQGLKSLWELFSKGVVDLSNWLWNSLVSTANAVIKFVEEVFKKILIEPIARLTDTVVEQWFEALGAKKKGEIGLMFDIARRFMWEYWRATVLIYLVNRLPRAFGDLEVEFEPRALGTGVGGLISKIKLSEIVTAMVEGFKDFYPSFLTGAFVGIGSTLMRPVEFAYRAKFVTEYDGILPEIYKDILKDEAEKGAIINAFVESPGITEIKEWIRRQLVLTEGTKNKKELDKLIATMRAHLKLYGMPKWYIDYLSDVGEKLKITFPDRFGRERQLLLSTIFEIPTHSELARMTQRDVLPGVDIMKKLGWIRGWNEDLTTIMYLMTFKYPSFEKLWTFYMRATAGLLWFSPPETIKQIFSMEAQEIGAGAPISPLDIQKALKTPENLKGIETALNTYFKWLEYSNFSWFTPNTEMYGVKVGQEIYNKLGGWTADSWIMADVAADIPGKIDLRWMSRYGIFMWMSEKFERLGVAFESYTPLVEVVPKLLENKPTSPITVSLEWMSKLLQATGLHPAWVPLTTVAENIMVISDEMTLLRTGWLNLFKEGMLKVEDVEQSLAGLLKISYRVGYWDPASKQWNIGYITLPVRWLPHERRLLELRMLMDRILDLYRELEKYVSTGVRTLAITAETGVEILKKSVELLNSHYSKVAEQITGQKLSIAFDEEYAKLRLELLKTAQIIEVKERLRYWWFRISGWVLYRIAGGYVSFEDIDRMIDTVSKVVPLFNEEIEGYKIISKAVLGIVQKENIPTPSQLATLNEIVTVDVKLVEKVLVERNIPEEFRPIWKEYIIKKPLKDDFNKLMNAYYKAEKYGVSIPKEIEVEIQKWFNYFKVTEEEKKLRSLATYLEVLVAESKEYLPTPSTLATLSEYVVIPQKLIEEVFEKKRVPEEWRKIWIEYITVKPIKSDYKSLINVARRAYVYGVISEKEWKEILEAAKIVGFKDIEIQIYSKIADLYVLIEESKEYIPTPSQLATINEYVTVSDELIKEVLDKRHVKGVWRQLWEKYIKIKPLSDDARYLLHRYLTAKKYGVKLTEEEEKKIKEIFNLVGITDLELEIRELAVTLEMMKETIPTLGQLATMAEYIEIPLDYVKQILQRRRVETVFGNLWVKYIYAKMISGEVNAVVATYRRIYEYFYVPGEISKKIEELMLKGGWVKDELEIFHFDLELRKAYRIMQYLVPTIRQFAADARYIPEWETLFNDLLKARGIDATKYKKQIDYYKKLIRNRMVWRQIAWYRSRLAEAYANGIIDKTTLRKKLEILKKYGLSDEEIELIMDGMELHKAYVQKVYGGGA